MASMKTLAALIVLLAGVTYLYYVNIPVPPNFSTLESRKLRLFALAMDLAKLLPPTRYQETEVLPPTRHYEAENGVLRSFPTNAHVHLTNFMKSAGNIFCEADDQSIKFTDMRIDGGVKIRLYEPVERKKARAGLVYFHGGGFVYGSTDTHHALTHHLAAELGIVLVSVDYRLSWQELFPAAIDDCTKATVWFMLHAKKYNVDPNKIAIAGDSGGGNAAAAVAGRLTFEDVYAHLPRLKFQGLFYPPLQGIDFKLPSYQQYGEMSSVGATKELLAYCYSNYGWRTGTSEIMQAMMVNNHTAPEAKKQFAKLLSHDMIPAKFKKTGYKPPVNENYGDRRIYDMIKGVFLNPDAAPLMREDLRGLPPAYIVTAQFDPLRDENIIYVRRLQDAGVEVTWKHYESGIHGMFMHFTGSLSLESGKQSVKDFIDYAHQNL